MRKVTLYLPEEMARALRVKAAEEFTSLGKVVERALTRELGLEDKEVPRKKK